MTQDIPSVGGRVARPEGPDKVSGRAIYIADLDFQDAWYGAVVRSPIPRGTLLGYEVDEGFDVSSVTLIRACDIPGDNVVAMIEDDQPILVERDIQHVGEPLFLVAAKTEEVLRQALLRIRPKVDVGEPLFDPLRSTHRFKEITISKGKALSILKDAKHVFEGEYRTDTQEQMYIEPQGMIALPADSSGGQTVYGSLQCPYYVQKSLARCLNIELKRARVVQAATGGGFGGKEDYPSVLACHAALLARACERPVRMIFDRHEDLKVTPKRHPSIVRHRTAVDGEGRLIAMDIEVILDGGAYATLSPVVLSRACIHASGPYRCENVRIHGVAVKTNHVPYGAFRGFGAPQTCFAVERQLDRIASNTNVHPYELRRINKLRPGDSTATGQVLKESVGSEAVMERIREVSGFDRYPWKHSREVNETGLAPRVLRGVGFSFFFHGSGFTGSGEAMLKGRITLELKSDGRIRVRSASTEFGQGTQTMFLAIASDALSTDPGDIEIAEVDTDSVPNSGPTVASRTCMIVGSVLVNACRELIGRLGDDGDFRKRVRDYLRDGGDRFIEAEYASPKGLTWDDKTYRGDAYPVYGWGADVAEVEVDLDTFEVRVTRFITAIDVGKAIQPQMVRGQIEGGSLQALGFAHLEVVQCKEGRVVQDRMSTSIIPTTLDAPSFEVEILEVPFEHGPFGAKGVGEMPMDGGAPAFLSALEDALGLHLTHIPATPERIMEAWYLAHPEESS